jgi:hypothetical protein
MIIDIAQENSNPEGMTWVLEILTSLRGLNKNDTSICRGGVTLPNFVMGGYGARGPRPCIE